MLTDFERFLSGRLDPITENDVFNYYDYICEREGVKPRDGGDTTLSSRTIRNYMDTLRSMFETLRRKGKISRNPFESADIKLPHREAHEKRPTEILDFAQVIHFCNTPSRFTKTGVRNRAILAVLFGGALRRTEAIDLKISDVRAVTESDGGTTIILKLWQTKAQKPQEQPLPHWAAERVLHLVQQRKFEGALLGQPLITNYRGREPDKEPDNAPMYVRTFDRLFGRMRRDAGLSNHITIHSARATAISYLFECGLPVRSIQEFSRHANSKTTEGYDRRKKRHLSVCASKALSYDKNHRVTEKVVARNQDLVVQGNC